jgi:NADH:ubiquinone oxidoreductase subunit 3 (subunit A)
MAIGHLELFIFAAVALLVPALVLAFSKLVRPVGDDNGARAQHYESGEEGVGRPPELMTDYSRYLVVFTAFAVLAAVVVLWSVFVRQLDVAGNLRIALLLVLGFVMAAFVLALGRRGV